LQSAVTQSAAKAIGKNSMNRLLIFFILLLFGTITASACTCLDSREYYYKKAKMVFQGKIDSIGTDQFKTRQLTFTVLKIWKGSAKDKVTLFADDLGGCSAFMFQEGKTYIVYAYPVEHHRSEEVGYDMFASSSCGESLETHSEYAKKVTKQLNSFWFRFKARWWPF
jgi:hypothetical protein